MLFAIWNKTPGGSWVKMRNNIPDEGMARSALANSPGTPQPGRTGATGTGWDAPPGSMILPDDGTSANDLGSAPIDPDGVTYKLWLGGAQIGTTFTSWGAAMNQALTTAATTPGQWSVYWVRPSNYTAPTVGSLCHAFLKG